MSPEHRESLKALISGRRREIEGVVADGIVHGKEHAYKKLRCRCDECRAESTLARRRRRNQAKQRMALEGGRDG